MSLATHSDSPTLDSARAGEPGSIAAPDPAGGPEPYGELGLFHKSLAGFCRAELPLPDALRNLQLDLSAPGLRAECAAMAEEIEAGVPFETAYGRRAERFPPVYGALVEAGLRSGDLPGVLEEIAVDASLRARVRDQLRRRLELPLLASGIVFVLGAALTLAVSPVVPGQSAVLTGGGDALQPPTLLFVLIGTGLLALLAVLAVGVAMLRRPLEPGSGPRGLRYRLPFLGPLRSHAAKAGFASTMALLLRREVPLPRALELCRAGCDGAEVQDQVGRMAECASQGGGLTDSVRAGDLIPPSLLWFVESAGSGEDSARALGDIAAIYRQRLQRATDRVAVFALPVVQLLIGFVVLAFALAYVVPAYGLFEVLYP